MAQVATQATQQPAPYLRPPTIREPADHNDPDLLRDLFVMQLLRRYMADPAKRKRVMNLVHQFEEEANCG